MSEYHLKPGKLGEKVIDAYKGIEEKFVDTFLEEDGSLDRAAWPTRSPGAYQKVEDTVVGGYKKWKIPWWAVTKRSRPPLWTRFWNRTTAQTIDPRRSPPHRLIIICRRNFP